MTQQQHTLCRNRIADYGRMAVMASAVVLIVTHVMYLSSVGVCPPWLGLSGTVLFVVTMLWAGAYDPVGMRLSIPTAALGGACILSLLVNDVPAEMMAWPRLLNLGLLAMAVSPLVMSDKLRRARRLTLRVLAVTLALLALVSALLSVAEALGGAPHKFRGLFRLSMSMSQASALAAVMLMPVLLRSRNRVLTVAAGVAVAAALWMCVAGGSRMCIVSVPLVTALECVAVWRRGGAVRPLRPLAVFAAAALMTLATWQSSMHCLTTKMNYAQACGSHIVSRSSMWDDRIGEFADAPLTGIGFSNQTHFDSPLCDRDRTMSTGWIEPGSSYLEVAAMTGVIGAAALVWMLVSIGQTVWRRRRCVDIMALGAAVLLLLLAITEGFILSANSVLSLALWLALGILADTPPPPHTHTHSESV